MTTPEDAGSAPQDYPMLEGAPPPPSALAPPGADAFYGESLRLLAEARHTLPGRRDLPRSTATRASTGPTKDLDVFRKAGDFPRILLHFQERGFATEIEDERWLAKVRRGDCFFDVIFASATAVIAP